MIKVGNWEIRITRHWYGLYKERRFPDFFHAFSIGFIHFVKGGPNE